MTNCQTQIYNGDVMAWAKGETLRNQDETPDMAAKIERCLQRGRGLALTRDGVA